MDGACHGKAAANEHRGAHCAQNNVEMVARMPERGWIQRTIHGVAAEHADEKQNLRHQKDPHTKRGRVLLLFDVVELVPKRQRLVSQPSSPREWRSHTPRG